MEAVGGRMDPEHDLIRFRKAVESSGEVVFLTDPKGIITWINPEFTGLYGYSPSEVVGLHTPRLLKSGLMAPKVYEQFWHEILKKQTVKAEFINRTKDGRLVTIEGSANAVLDEHEAILGFVAIQRDVSARKEIERRLRESEELYRTLVETSPDGIVLAGLDGTIQLCNPTLVAMSGCATAADLVGRNALQLLAEEDRTRAPDIFEKAREGRQSPSHMEFHLERKDGIHIPCELNFSVVRSEDGQPRGFLGVLRDITSRKKLEAQLLQAQKMEAIGRLAGGISHDFNNLLTAILGYTDLISGDPRTPQGLQQDLQAIRKASERATSLTRQLLAFSRRQILQPKTIDLNSTIAETDKMLRRLIGEDIQLITMLDPDLSPIRADPGQIEQVILNLAVNGRDAMPHGGVLTIETRNVTLDEDDARSWLIQPGPYVLLSVRDTGTGMDAGTQSHMFEPFFTTKEQGKGTGLGLSTVYGIVKQSGGHILVRSEQGKGTVFRLYLPSAHEEAGRTEKAASPAPSPQPGQTILLVEDEEWVRSMMNRALSASGYSILQAGDGSEALELADHFGGRIHLLLTDLVMPRMGGVELARILATKDPHLKILYLSGYSDQAITQDSLDAGRSFLQKPFTPDALVKAVRELLD
jgi:PAS domain S-box-containing protein